jgi:hypothetical protein
MNGIGAIFGHFFELGGGPMTIQTVTIGTQTFTYDPSAIREGLKEHVDNAGVERILTEIGKGNVSSLKQYNLDNLLVSSQFSPPNLDMNAMTSALERLNGFNFLDAMRLLHETAKQLRQASREMRHAEADIAVAESMNAAAKIRSAAIVNLVVGVVQGTVSIGMGVASIGSSVTQMRNMAGASGEMKAAQIEMRQNQADGKLAQSQMELKQVKADISAGERLQSDVQAAEAKVQNLELQARSADMDANATPEIRAERHAEVEAAKLELTAKREELAAYQTQHDLPALESKASGLEATIKSEAAEAAQANQKQIESLEKSIEAGEAKIKDLDAQIKDKQTEIAKLMGKTPVDAAKVGAANQEMVGLNDQKVLVRQQITDNQAKLDVCQQNVSMYNAPTSAEALAGAQQRYADASAQLNEGVNGTAANRHAKAQTDFQQILTEAQTEANKIQGVNQTSQGANQIIGGIGQMISEDMRADGAESTARAQAASAKESENADFQKSFNELLQSVQDIMKQYLQAQNQANAAVYRNM